LLCERLRTQTQRRANTPSTAKPPEGNGNPCHAFGKNMEKLYPQMVGVPLGHWENRLNHLKETQVLGISTPPDTKTSLATAADGPQRCYPPPLWYPVVA
jgi:hypothetical protein